MHTAKIRHASIAPSVALISAALTLAASPPAGAQVPATIADLPSSHATPHTKNTNPDPNDVTTVPPATTPHSQKNPNDPDAQAPSFPAPTMPQEMLDGFKPVAAAAFNLADVSVQELRMTEHAGETLVALHLPQGDRVVHLHPFSMRDPNARLLVQDVNGLLIDTPWPELTTYRGTVTGEPNVDVAASIIHGKVSMMILPDDHTQPTWFMQPLSDAVEGMPAGLAVVYRDGDALPSNAGCGWEMLGGVPAGADVPAPVPARQALAKRVENGSAANKTANDKPAAPNGGEEGGIAGDDGSLASANVRCQIAYDADFEFYQLNGSSVFNTIADMELIMNQVALIYQNQVQITYTDTGIIVRSAEPDPYTSTDTSTTLCQFGDWWNANATGITRDVAHLFTGKVFPTVGGVTTVGLAWRGVVCNVVANTNPPCNGGNKAYSWVRSRFSSTMAQRVQDSAHELGHNWNCCHCDQQACTGSGTPDADCGIMNSLINGSTTFEVRGHNAIVGYRDAAGCLDPWFNPTYVNWSWGGFENGSISNPWNTIFEGLDACLTGGSLVVQGGNYLQNPNIFRAKTITPVNGTVRIGSN